MKRGDRVMTPEWCARDIVGYFGLPDDGVLEPFRGSGVFTTLCPGWDWCEIDDGRDFFDHADPVDYIVSNPPYSKTRLCFRHAATLAENIIFLVPLRNVFSGYGFIKEIMDYGGIKAIRLYGTGGNLGFPMGNAIGAMHFARGWTGPTTWSDGSGKKNEQQGRLF